MVQSTASRRFDSPRYIGLRMSADEFLALPDDGFKYQVIGGVVVMSPSPTPHHQALLLEVCSQIRDFLKVQPIARVFPDIDVRFGADLVYRPDLVVVLNARLPKPLRRIDVAPDLIVEILSPGTASMDEQTKLADYERCGVREYWIVNPGEPLSVRALRLEGREAGAGVAGGAEAPGGAGRFVQAAAGGGRVLSSVLPGFGLDVEALRRIE